MGMRLAGFMAARKEDRLAQEARDEAKSLRDDTYQRQLERDDMAHQRQLDLLDIRQKNALKLSGIAESKAQKKADAKMRRKVDAFIRVRGLADTPAVRSEITSGFELYGTEKFLEGIKSGRFRLESPGGNPPPPPVADPNNIGVEVDAIDDTSEVSVTPDALSVDVPAVDQNPVSVQSELSLSDTDAQMAAITEEPSSGEGLNASEGPVEGAEDVPVAPPGSPLDNTVEAAPDGPLISYDNNPYIKLEDYAGQDSKTLAQSIRMLEQKGYSTEELAPLKAELDFVKKAEKDPVAGFASMLLEADSFGKLSALQGNLDVQLSDKTITLAEHTSRSAEVTNTMNTLVDINRKNAEKDGDPLMFASFTPTGSIGAAGQMVYPRDGKYYDAANNEVDISKGRVLPADGYETFVRNYNNAAQKIATDVDQGVGAIQALSDYRALVINAPQGLNPYLSVAGRLVGEANSIKSAFEGVVNGEYGYSTFENSVMSTIRDLSAEDKKIARAQLRAAYAMAAFAGSSGQALSDRELMMNLENIGKGITDPRKVVGLLNTSMQEIVTRTEQTRSTKFNSFIASEELKGTMSTTPIGMNFTDYLPNVLDEATQVSLKDALANETEYAYKSAGATASSIDFSDIPNITFGQFVEFLKTKPMADPSQGTFYDNFTEDELRKFFKDNGGKL
jgi:hypothetical protein